MKIMNKTDNHLSKNTYLKFALPLFKKKKLSK